MTAELMTWTHVLDDRPAALPRCLVALGVRLSDVPESVQAEIAEALVDDCDYLEQVRRALTARGYLPQPEKPSRIPDDAPAQ